MNTMRIAVVLTVAIFLGWLSLRCIWDILQFFFTKKMSGIGSVWLRSWALAAAPFREDGGVTADIDGTDLMKEPVTNVWELLLYNLVCSAICGVAAWLIIERDLYP